MQKPSEFCFRQEMELALLGVKNKGLGEGNHRLVDLHFCNEMRNSIGIGDVVDVAYGFMEWMNWQATIIINLPENDQSMCLDVDWCIADLLLQVQDKFLP